MGWGSLLTDASERLEDHLVVLMPDLYVDRFLPVDDASTFHERVEQVRSRGGGNVLMGEQWTRVGGNAANTTLALARLGVPVAPLVWTDPLGARMLEDSLDGLPADLGAVQVGDASSSTVALEFGGADGANVMLSDPGPLATLGPEDVPPEAWERIDAATLVGVTNWSQTLQGGTELLETVLPRAQRGGARTLLDTGDPAHRGDDVRELLESPVLGEHLDIWSMNLQEAQVLTELQGHTPRDPRDAATILAKGRRGRVDLHTRSACWSLGEGADVEVGTFDVEPQVRTGAGDAWNAGNILGTLLKLPDRDRLVLANAVAARTLATARTEPPTLEDVASFLDRHEPQA